MPLGKGKHGWLVGALADAGYRQRDVAKAWGVNDAVVSRFIKAGRPALSLERANVLAKMLGMNVAELNTRVSETLPPNRRLPIVPQQQALEPPVNGTHRDDPDAALANLRAAVARARKALPKAEITVRIKMDEEL